MLPAGEQVLRRSPAGHMLEENYHQFTQRFPSPEGGPVPWWVRLEASQRPTGAGVQVRAERQVVGAVEGARVVRLHGKASTGMCPALTGAATASAATASSATASSGARRQLGAGPSAVCSATGCSASSCCRGRRGYRGAIVECAVVTVLP